MKQDSDEILMIRARDENPDNIAELFERYHVRLYNFFLKQTFHVDASKDLVQSVFYRIIKYKKSYNEMHQFKTWMYQIARNVMLDYFEKGRQYPKNKDDFAYLQEQAVDPELDAEKTAQQKILYNSLAKLPPDQRELIVLSKFQGLKYKDISQMNGSTEAAVKVKVHRALQKLKKIYFEEEQQ